MDKIDNRSVQQWFTQQSGILIKPEIIDDLEAKWFKFIKENKYIRNSFVSNDVLTDVSESYLEGKSKEIVQTRHERNPQARKICLSHHGYTCQICGSNFEEYFGNIGKGYMHVHRINSIA